jgi:soluble cytochrome b562
MEIRPSKRLNGLPVSTVLQKIRVAALPAMGLGALVACGWMVFSAYSWLTANPPIPDCKTLSSLSPDSSRLYCTEKAAKRSGRVEDIVAGFALVRPWSASHPLYNQSRRAVKTWSQALLTIAQQKAEKGELEVAIQLARKIPVNSPIHKEVNAAIATWEASQNRGQRLVDGFQQALQRQDWQTAKEKVRQFARLNPEAKWQADVNRLRQRLTLEQSARSQLQQARSMVDDHPGDASYLAKAIAQADRVGLGSYARNDANSDITRWSQTLLAAVSSRMRQSDFPGAIALARVLPFDLSLPAELHDLVWLSRAQEIAARKLPTHPLTEEIRQVWMTRFHLGQIRDNSPFYAQAQSLNPTLTRQFEDLNQLQFASEIARLGQIPSLQLAIHSARAIAPDRPQRLYAQTLITDWEQDIQRLVDRPDLVKAQQIAAAGTIPSLKQAIAQAQRILPGRALKPEATASIAEWNRQIQTIEDQPLLDRAQNLAQQKKLKEAIQTAAQIHSNRALYAKAQASIKGWNNQIQIAEDRPILDRAKNLAEAGDVFAAVETASRINPGRALYSEAQATIDRWMNQRYSFRPRFRRYAPRFDDFDPGDMPPYRPYRPYRRYTPGPAPFPELPPP